MGITACKQDKSSSQNDANQTKTEKSTDKSKYTLTPFSISPSFPDAKLSQMEYQNGEFSFSVSGDSYALGSQTSDAPTKMCANSGKGQHIHLIVDNSPYAAKYTSKFAHDVTDGEHNVLAFLSRSYHESIKTSSAHILSNVTVKDKSIVSSKPVTTPTLSYSRPKGTYIGKDTEKVMLDFYLSNVELANGYTVEANINGEKHVLNNWQPYYIEGLPMERTKLH